MGDFYNGGLRGNFSFFVGSNWNFVSGFIKNVDTHPESFSWKKTSNKKVIAKKPLTNLYEMNSRSEWFEALWVPTAVRSEFYSIHISTQLHIYIMSSSSKVVFVTVKETLLLMCAHAFYLKMFCILLSKYHFATLEIYFHVFFVFICVIF